MTSAQFFIKLLDRHISISKTITYCGELLKCNFFSANDNLNRGKNNNKITTKVVFFLVPYSSIYKKWWKLFQIDTEKCATVLNAENPFVCAQFTNVSSSKYVIKTVLWLRLFCVLQNLTQQYFSELSLSRFLFFFYSGLFLSLSLSVCLFPI